MPNYFQGAKIWTEFCRITIKVIFDISGVFSGEKKYNFMIQLFEILYKKNGTLKNKQLCKETWYISRHNESQF